jgi:DnaJ-domain-containing protein 1
VTTFSSQDNDDDEKPYTVTEVEITVSRKKQIENYEPFQVSESLSATVHNDCDIDTVTEELSNLAKEHVQREIVKRVEEQQMLEELEE